MLAGAVIAMPIALADAMGFCMVIGYGLALYQYQAPHRIRFKIDLDIGEWRT